MPTVWIPPLLRHLTHDQESIQVAGATVGELIDALEARYPGIQVRLCQGDAIRPGLAVMIDTQLSREGLPAPVQETSEVHFIPAIAGGQADTHLVKLRYPAAKGAKSKKRMNLPNHSLTASLCLWR